MENASARSRPERRQMLRSRVFWFIAGASVNYLLIATPFKWLRTHTGLPIWAVSACSLGISTTFFFAWNYFINFRTDSRKRDAFARYLTAVACMWVLSSATLTLLKSFNAHLAFSLGRFPLDLDIIATQFFLSGLKFFLYHKWAFPLPKETAADRRQHSASPILTAIVLGVLGILLIVFGAMQWSSAASQIQRAFGQADLLAISLFVSGGVALLIGLAISIASSGSVANSPPPVTNSVEERLRQLDKLHSQHLISDPEYEQRRKDIIASL